MADLHVAGQVDAKDVGVRFRSFEDHQRIVAHHARVGALVTIFSNEEIHHLAAGGHLSIGDVFDLRRLGLLGPDEGWTGGPRKARRTPDQIEKNCDHPIEQARFDKYPGHGYCGLCGVPFGRAGHARQPWLLRGSR